MVELRAARFLERLEVGLEFRLSSLHHQAHHKLGVNVLNRLLRHLEVRVLTLEHC